MKNMIRLRLDGATVLELDPTTIHTFQIQITEDNEHMLTATNNSAQYILKIGTFDECHNLLNILHETINVNIIDITEI